jgi:hypothetical protein
LSNLPPPGAGYTWTAGQIPTAAQLNANLRDYLAFLSNPPLFVADQTSAQSIPNTTFTPLTLATPATDTFTGWSSSTPSRYTCQAAGWYSPGGVVGYAANATGFRIAVLRINGSTYVTDNQAEVGAAASGGTYVPISDRPIYLNANDYVELIAYHSAGAALNTVASQSFLSLLWVHA